MDVYARQPFSQDALQILGEAVLVAKGCLASLNKDTAIMVMVEGLLQAQARLDDIPCSLKERGRHSWSHLKAMNKDKK